MADALSLRAYAAHRKRQGLTGGSLQAVQRAVQSERLKASVTTVEGLQRIDPELADREWVANTDQSRQPAAPLEGDDDQAPGFAFWKAKKMELDYLRAAEKVVDAEEMAAAMSTAYAAVRTKVLGLPAKAKQLLPHLTLADLATLDDIVREALDALATEAA